MVILCCSLLLACFVVFIYALCVVSSKEDRQRAGERTPKGGAGCRVNQSE